VELAVEERDAQSHDGKTGRPPRAMDFSMPLRTALMNWRGTAPPTIASMNSKGSSGLMGSTFRFTTANWPCPPVCFFSRPSHSRAERMVS